MLWRIAIASASPALSAASCGRRQAFRMLLALKQPVWAGRRCRGNGFARFHARSGSFEDA